MTLDPTKPMEARQHGEFEWRSLSPAVPSVFNGAWQTMLNQEVVHFDLSGQGRSAGKTFEVRNIPTQSPDINERMAEHFRKVAAKYADVVEGSRAWSEDLAEIRAIVRELDGPQTDEEWAAQMAKEAGWESHGSAEQLALFCIRRGRELQKQEDGK